MRLLYAEGRNILHSTVESDFELMQRVQGRDTSALAGLYDRHGSRVFSLGVIIVGEGAAEEVTQDGAARWQELRYLVDELPHEQREVILLAFYRGLSQSDIAAYLDVPLGTIKTRMRLGMDKLRTAWR